MIPLLLLLLQVATPRFPVQLGAKIFGGLVVTAYALGWIMYFAFGR